MSNFTERDRITVFSSNHTSSYTCLIMQHMYMDRDTNPQRNTRSASCSPYEKWETQTIAKEANRTTHNCDLLQLHQYTNTCRAKTWLSCPFLFICRDYVYVCERTITAYDDSLWALGEWSEWARVCVWVWECVMRLVVWCYAFVVYYYLHMYLVLTLKEDTKNNLWEWTT